MPGRGHKKGDTKKGAAKKGAAKKGTAKKDTRTRGNKGQTEGAEKGNEGDGQEEGQDEVVENPTPQPEEREGPLIPSARLDEAADWIEAHTVIWDTGDANWKRQDTKADVWAAGAKEFGLSVVKFQRWYNTVRTDLSRILKANKKEKSGSGAPVKLPPKKLWVWERFAFLKKHIKGRDQGQELVSVSSIFIVYS
jgi:hypothetical protein